MAIEVVNWNDLEYETREKGVRFRVDRAAISDHLGAERLGYHASVLPPGKADGPRRFHLVNERMVLVLGGRPTLRLGTAEYALSPGDVACLPPLASAPWQLLNRGDRPAHVFDAGTVGRRAVIGFPDSGKRLYRVHGELGEPDVEDVVLRDDRVTDVWDGEPYDEPLPPAGLRPDVRDPRIASGSDVPWEEFGRHPFHGRRKRLAKQVEAERLGYSFYQLAPGERPFPFHFHHVNEEFFYVRSGYGRLRTREGERDLKPGDMFACPAGSEGAHGFLNAGDAPFEYFALSTMEEPEVVEYPDSAKTYVMVGSAPGGDPNRRSVDLVVRQRDAVDVEEGER